tara:strand:+ start:153 stop:281 length:129 start_codon:yes stop_codon:yes gene_type:complete
MWYAICYFAGSSVVIVGGTYLMMFRVPQLIVKVSDKLKGVKS